ncbi:ankyrin repeat domain-containing protein [Massilia pseudoviolaceinigra]|uniref:ankyrin repeat domain-containing protein n=2 Tax=Massilia TaxID=149698 RepID=UPI0027968B09|nr:ankyrin repeat domain-containing protein [Massilia sp. CCM 9206]MDQ1922899.1 ankyrin repeat domain-containing protein [Massilia sp. CCM 9206]
MNNTAPSLDHGRNEQLISAAKSGSKAAVVTALAGVTDIDYRDQTGWTALMWAARFHHHEIVTLLAQKGASLSRRDGINHDAWDISARHYLENDSASGLVRDFIGGHAQYKVDQEKMAEAAKAFAKGLAKLFGGRTRAQGVAYTHAAYEVRATYRNMQCRFMVFDGGFDLWVQNFRAGDFMVSLNLEGRDNATHPSEYDGLDAFGEVFSESCPAYIPSVSNEDSKNFFRNEEIRKGLEKLKVGKFEWLIIGPGQLRFRNQTTDMEVVNERIESLANIFATTNRTPRPPVLTQQFAMKIGAAKAEIQPHIFGGTTATPISCPNCDEIFGQIALFDAQSPEFSELRWKHEKIEVACCFSCALPETSSLTCISYASDVPVVLRYPEEGGMTESEKFLHRPLELVPIDPKKHQTISRVGGRANWIQADTTPVCPSCENTMHFLAQFVSTNRIMFGADMGIAYVFLCPSCDVVGTAIQSH